MLSLGQVRASRIPLVTDYCGDSDEFRELVNEAQQAIIYRGKWWGLYQKIRICVDRCEGCLTWPRMVAGIEAIAVEGVPILNRNEWWEFLQWGPGLMPKRRSNCTSCSEEYGWCGPSVQNYDRGTSPLFRDIVGSQTLRFYAGSSSDWGKEILVKGYDANNQWIRSIVDGVWIDGFYMTLADPYVDSAFELTSITSIQKPETDEAVYAYTWDGTSEVQIAVWQADETIPSYRRTFINNLKWFPPNCPTDDVTVTAMVKLEYAPAIHDTDLLMVGNMLALKYMVMSIMKREKNLEAEAIALERASLRELNRELDHRLGDPKMKAIGMYAFGSAYLGNQRIGTLI